MGKVVAAVGLSHAPGKILSLSDRFKVTSNTFSGAIGFPETAKPDARARTEAATLALGKALTDAQPDVIFAFLDDHFENFYRNLMPTIAVSIAEHHVGPADQWMEPLHISKKTYFPGNPAMAEALIHSLVGQGFDVSRTGPVEYGNNLLMPWVLMETKLPNVSIIPIFLNVFTPPLMKYSRAYALGEACRKAVEQDMPADLKVAFMCTGGLSHWPPYWNPKPGRRSAQGRFPQAHEGVPDSRQERSEACARPVCAV